MDSKKEPMKKIEKRNNAVWITQPEEIDLIIKRQQKALDVAWGKVNDNGKIETMIHTAEAFGRSLFAEFIENKEQNWTMDKWIKPVVENVFNPMGTGATLTEISEDVVTSMVFRYNKNEKLSPYMFSLFNYGFLRGMLKSAFPDGEIIFKKSMADGCSVDIFTFIAKVDSADKLEIMEKMKEQFENNSKT